MAGTVTQTLEPIFKDGRGLGMKKTLVGTILILVLATTAIATIGTTISQAITSSGYVAVRLPVETGCEAFSLWTEDGSGFYIASKPNGSDGILLPDGMAFSLTQRFYSNANGAILCYAKGTTSTNIVGLIVL